ncbi:MAG TPA: MFS transporter [Micropepsaceae bacterium]|jgi:MFS family permease|nr:MFS transporter [Micropepsaceae bacterium]
MPDNSIDAATEKAIVRKLTWRLALPITLGFLIAYIDRANAGFAALQMNRDLGLSNAEYGFGASLFFISYVIFEIPSTLAQARIGGPRWLARIMISWGIASAGMMFVAGANSFYGVRLLIGAAEAGYFPGAMLYLAAFFPPQHRARVMALFAVAIPLSSVVGSPISGALLGLDGALGFRGWQWMFLIEGVPAVLLGLAFLFLLPAELSAASWLTGREKSWLAGQLATEAAATRVPHGGVWRVMFDPYVLLLSLAFTGSVGVSQALALWQPQMIKEFGLTNFQVGLTNAIPFALAAIAMLAWGRRSDLMGERLWHTILPLALSTLALAATAFVHELWLFILLLCLTMIGSQAMKGPFLGLTSEWLAGPAAVVGFAQVNALGNVAAIVTTSSIGFVRDATGSFQLALLPLMLIAAIGCVGLPIAARKSAIRRGLIQPARSA